MNKLPVFLFVMIFGFGVMGTANSADKDLEALREHRTLKKDVRQTRLKYRVDLNKAILSRDKDSLLRVVEKKGIRDLLRKLPPPVPPSVKFFPFPWPDPYPDPPDPGGWIPRIDREWLLRVERFRQKPSLAQFCELTQSLSLDPTDYIDAEVEGSASGSQSGHKSVSVRASAGQSTTGHPLVSSALCGFRSIMTVPEGDNPMIEITSTLNSSFSWIEANTHIAVDITTGGSGGGGGYAKVSAKALLNVYANGEVINANPATIVSGGVSGQDQLYYPDPSDVGTEISVRINLPTGGPYEIVVEELLELTAAGSDGHAYISGGFTWDPLAVVIQEGCHWVLWKSGAVLPY